MVGFSSFLLATSVLIFFWDFAGPPDGETLIASKWESLALAPACDPAFPDDYFLITVVRLCFIPDNFFFLF